MKRENGPALAFLDGPGVAGAGLSVCGPGRVPGLSSCVCSLCPSYHHLLSVLSSNVPVAAFLESPGVAEAGLAV